MTRTHEAATVASTMHLREGAQTQAHHGRPTQVALDRLDDNPFQHRTEMETEKLEELAASIASSGLLQPVSVRALGGRWQVIAGHRRVAAYRLLQERASAPDEARRWATIPAVERAEVSDEEMQRLGLTENLQRDDPSALDAAASLAAYQARHQLTTDELAERMSLAVDRVQRLLRLANAPQVVKNGVTKGVMVPVVDDAGNPIKTASGRDKQEHRHLDLLAALEFTRLYEQLARESPRKAGDRVESVIRRALEAGWGFRRIKSHCAALRAGRSDRSTAEITKAVSGPCSPSLFVEKGGVLTIYRERIAGASVESRAALVALLDAVAAQAQPCATLPADRPAATLR